PATEGSRPRRALAAAGVDALCDVLVGLVGLVVAAVAAEAIDVVTGGAARATRPAARAFGSARRRAPARTRTRSAVPWACAIAVLVVGRRAGDVVVVGAGEQLGPDTREPRQAASRRAREEAGAAHGAVGVVECRAGGGGAAGGGVVGGMGRIDGAGVFRACAC